MAEPLFVTVNGRQYRRFIPWPHPAVYWISPAGVVPVAITFFGLAHEAAIATYLVEICGRAMRTELQRLERATALLRPAFRRRQILPHLDGMADRLRERILALREPERTGTGLVVLRDQLVRAALKAEGIELQDRTNMRQSRDFEAAYADGRRAGDRVALNPGLGGSPPAGVLGRRAGQ